MDQRRKELQARIARRRKLEQKKEGPRPDIVPVPLAEKDGHMYESPSFTPSEPEGGHPLFKKELFLFKVMASVCLFLAIAVMYKHPSVKLDPARSFVSKTMEQEFQFASVTAWYEETFGRPLAFLPDDKTAAPAGNKTGEGDYAVPVLGKITKSFEVDGEGITIETGVNSKVEAVNEGFVIFAGVKEGLGKTIVIQHTDKSESWYGELSDLKVGLYEFVKKGKEVGQVAASEDGSKGSFYLAIKQGDDFIDPKKVITFE